MKLLYYYFNESPQKTMSILFFSILAGMGEVSSVLLTVNGMQDVPMGRNYIFYAIFLPIAAATFVLSRRLSQIWTANLTETILNKLYIEIGNDIRHSELQTVETRNKSEIHLKMLKAQTITDISTKGVNAFQSLFAIFFLWLYVFWISPVGGLVCLLIFSLATTIHDLVQKQTKPIFDEEAKIEKELSNIFDHILYGAKEIRICPKKNYDLFENRLIPILFKVKESRIKLLFIFSQYWIFVFACFFVILIAIAFLFPSYYPVGTTFSLLVICFYVWTPLLMIITVLPEITAGKTAMDDLFQLAQDKNSNQKTTQFIYNPLKEQTIEFAQLSLENIGFKYKSQDGKFGFPLESITFTGSPGEIIIVCGGNGSGKTTMMKIITGLYPQSSGQILINNNSVQMTEYRHLFSTVFSDFHLFDSIYGVDTIDDTFVNNLLVQTRLNLVTKWIPDKKKFSTTHLSAGQKRRLALITSLIEDKPIYIFDEWTADQDPQFRKYFYETLLPFLKKQGKLIIAVSHDDRYFHIADKLLHMEYGRMISFKTPNKNTFEQKKESKNTKNMNYKSTHESIDLKKTSTEKKTYTQKKEHKIFELVQTTSKSQLINIFLYGLLSVIFLPVLNYSMFTVPYISNKSVEAKLFFISIITLVLILISYLRFCNYLILFIEDNIVQIRLKVMNQIRKTDLYSFEKTGIEKIQTSLTYDMKSISEISNAVAFISRSTFSIMGSLFFMAYLSKIAFFITISILFIAGFFFTYNQIMIRQTLYKVRESEKHLFDSVSDILNGFKELRLDFQKNNEFFNKRFISRCSQLKKLKLRISMRFIDIYTMVCSLWQTLFIILVLILPVIFYLPQNIIMMLAGFTVCLPIGPFADFIPRVTMSSISIKRLYELKDELYHLKSEHQGPTLDNIQSEFREIRYENIFFQYKENDNQQFSVGPLSINFYSGEIVFLAGGNGSGKSTLLNLLTGLYPFQSGKFFINNKEIEITQCRSLFSAIFYDVHLFDQFYGIENINTDKVNELLKLMKLEKTVQFNGKSFSTLDLSTGQKKRLAMVMAIMEDKPVYVFDEWAADQDPEFRKFFYENLLPTFKAQGKTVIAVTHDDRYFHIADRFIKLEYGKIFENVVRSCGRAA
ncbi:peptide ABC transporter ATP-binding protein [Candidatus Magnetomorum sp. HK-1]|nr:peptide ABC transporter ATP-binding protein [Candidatus Magnetomorum sp. HK-1]